MFALLGFFASGHATVVQEVGREKGNGEGEEEQDEVFDCGLLGLLMIWRLHS